MTKKSWKRSTGTTRFALLTASILAAPAAWAVPNLQFSSPNVAVTQVAPGGSIALFYVGHEWQDPVVRRGTLCQKLTDSDNDGTISFNYGTDLVNKAIWVAVDLANGNVSVGAPNGVLPIADNPDPAKLLEHPGIIEDSRQSLHLLLIRPGVDAWQGSSFDGAASDMGTASDGEVQLRLLHMKSITTGDNWTNRTGVRSGDVLVGLDPEFLTYYAVTVP